MIERHYVPGGCASFYQRDGYRFDVGATQVSGFAARGIHRILNARYGLDVSSKPLEPATIVHFPHENIVRFGDRCWKPERNRDFGPNARAFFRIARTDCRFDPGLLFALPGPSLGPALCSCTRARLSPAPSGFARHPGRDRGLNSARDASPALRSSMRSSRSPRKRMPHTPISHNGATALDIAREGTFHLTNGVSTISTPLARAARRSGSTILYRRRAVSIEVRSLRRPHGLGRYGLRLIL